MQFGVAASVVASHNFICRHIEPCLKAKQDNPEHSQGEPVNLTELHENSQQSLLVIHRERVLCYIDQ